MAIQAGARASERHPVGHHYLLVGRGVAGHGDAGADADPDHAQQQQHGPAHPDVAGRAWQQPSRHGG